MPIAAAAAKQSPMVDDMLMVTFLVSQNAMGLFILAAVGQWMLDNGLDK